VKIYISAIETDVTGKPKFDKDASLLLDYLKENGYALFWKKEWRPYQEIEHEIEACDALLAIVDETWTSSTWMASEVTWACGAGGAIETSNQAMQPIPVFLFPVGQTSGKTGKFPFGYPGTITLDQNATHAAIQMDEFLKQFEGKQAADVKDGRSQEA
jgi:hypothetical protein